MQKGVWSDWRTWGVFVLAVIVIVETLIIFMPQPQLSPDTSYDEIINSLQGEIDDLNAQYDDAGCQAIFADPNLIGSAEEQNCRDIVEARIVKEDDKRYYEYLRDYQPAIVYYNSDSYLRDYLCEDGYTGTPGQGFVSVGEITGSTQSEAESNAVDEAQMRAYYDHFETCIPNGYFESNVFYNTESYGHYHYCDAGYAGGPGFGYVGPSEVPGTSQAEAESNAAVEAQSRAQQDAYAVCYTLAPESENSDYTVEEENVDYTEPSDSE